MGTGTAFDPIFFFKSSPSGPSTAASVTPLLRKADMSASVPCATEVKKANDNAIVKSALFIPFFMKLGLKYNPNTKIALLVNIKRQIYLQHPRIVSFWYFYCLMQQALYTLSIHLLRLGFMVAALFHQKARLFVGGRKNIFLALNGIFSQRVKGKLVWVHCASLGEFEQGRP